MSKRTTSKISKLISALNKGSVVTTQQIISRVGFASVNSVTRAVCTLRERGYQINTVTTRTGATGYQLA